METEVIRAQAGNRQALATIVEGIQGKVYELALRMLGHPSDAEDAAQEILIKVITRMGSFRGESAFYTWVYRIAANHLLTTRQRKIEQMGLSFEVFEEGIERQGTARETASPEQHLLVDELRSNCMQAILVCLNRDLRLAFVLGDIFGVTGVEGAFILDITPAAFRQRLSRGRTRVRRFMKKNCGLIDPQNPCQCTRQLPSDVKKGWIDPKHPAYAGRIFFAPVGKGLEDRMANLNDLQRIATLFDTYPPRRPPEAFAPMVKRLLATPGHP
ncbi:MAG: RNA polymerase sigma factor [Desulfobacterales bacterium]|nr:RNA polymerase sigma factor [Desulfobacterales bacterium]